MRIYCSSRLTMMSLAQKSKGKHFTNNTQGSAEDMDKYKVKIPTKEFERTRNSWCYSINWADCSSTYLPAFLRDRWA